MSQSHSESDKSGTADKLYGEISTKELAAIFKEEGYSFKVDEDGDLIWTLEGFKALVVRDSKGESLGFRISFSDANATPAKANKWNSSMRYSRTFFDKDNDICLRLDLDLAGGVSKPRIKDYLKTCHLSMIMWIKDVVR